MYLTTLLLLNAQEIHLEIKLPTLLYSGFLSRPLFLSPGPAGRLAEGRPGLPRLKWNVIRLRCTSLTLIQWEAIRFLIRMGRLNTEVVGWG